MGASAPEPDANASRPGLVLLKATCQSPPDLVPRRGGGRCPVCHRLRPKWNWPDEGPRPHGEPREVFASEDGKPRRGKGGVWHKGALPTVKVIGRKWREVMASLGWGVANGPGNLSWTIRDSKKLGPTLWAGLGALGNALGKVFQRLIKN